MKRAELKELLRSAIYEGPTKRDNEEKKTPSGEIDELSPATLGSYIKKASKQAVDNAAHAAAPPVRGGIKQHRIDRDLLSKDRKSLPIHGHDGKRSEERKRHDHLTGHNVRRRQVGIAKAADKLARGPITQPQTPSSPATNVPTPAAASADPSNTSVPPHIQQAASKEAGGRVLFGRYYDGQGNYLGRSQDGKWIDAIFDREAKTQMEMYNKLMEIEAGKYTSKDRELVKEMIREVIRSCG